MQVTGLDLADLTLEDRESVLPMQGLVQLIADELGVNVVSINPLSYDWSEEMLREHYHEVVLSGLKFY